MWSVLSLVRSLEKEITVLSEVNLSASTILLTPRTFVLTKVLTKNHVVWSGSELSLLTLSFRNMSCYIHVELNMSSPNSVLPLPSSLFSCVKPRRAESIREKLFANRDSPGRSHKIQMISACYPERPASHLLRQDQCFRSTRPGLGRVISVVSSKAHG